MIAALAWSMLALQPVDMDEWWWWADCGEGSSVTWELEGGFSKATQVRTLKRKEADRLTISIELTVDGQKYDQQQVIRKPGPPSKDGKNPLDAACPTCGKHKLGEMSSGREKVKVADKELECDWIEVATFTCEGKTGTRTRQWYSKEVPGGLVKAENRMSEVFKTHQKVIAYGKK